MGEYTSLIIGFGYGAALFVAVILWMRWKERKLRSQIDSIGKFPGSDLVSLESSRLKSRELMRS